MNNNLLLFSLRSPLALKSDSDEKREIKIKFPLNDYTAKLELMSILKVRMSELIDIDFFFSHKRAGSHENESKK